MSDTPPIPGIALAGGSAPGAPIDLAYQGPPPDGSPSSFGRKRVYASDMILRSLAFASALVVVLMLASLLFVLGRSAMPSIKQYGAKFLISTTWRPNYRPGEAIRGPDGKYQRDKVTGRVMREKIPPEFGALPVIFGTAVSSGIALLFAVPLSFGAALYLVRIAPRYLAGPVSFLIEFLAAIPSIAYGIWGQFVLGPFLAHHVEPPLNNFFGKVPGLKWLHHDTVTGLDMFTAGMILGIMIIPIITAISRDVLRAVPRVQIEGTVALGATWWQSSFEMLRFSRSGLFGAIILGLARAAGETMAVTMVIGHGTKILGSPFAPSETMASLLANQFGNVENDLHRAALLEVALILLVMSLTFNILARWLVVGKTTRTA